MHSRRHNQAVYIFLKARKVACKPVVCLQVHILLQPRDTQVHTYQQHPLVKQGRADRHVERNKRFSFARHGRGKHHHLIVRTQRQQQVCARHAERLVDGSRLILQHRYIFILLMFRYLAQHRHLRYPVNIGAGTNLILQYIHQIDNPRRYQQAQQQRRQQHNHWPWGHLSGRDRLIEHLSPVCRGCQRQCVLFPFLQQHKEEARLYLLFSRQLHELTLLGRHAPNTSPVDIRLVVGIAPLYTQPPLHTAYGGVDILSQPRDLLVQLPHGRVILRHALREPLPLQHQSVIFAGSSGQRGILHPHVRGNGLV